MHLGGHDPDVRAGRDQRLDPARRDGATTDHEDVAIAQVEQQRVTRHEDDCPCLQRKKTYRMRHIVFVVARPVWNDGVVRLVRLFLTSRRHIDLVRVAGAGC